MSYDEEEEVVEDEPLDMPEEMTELYDDPEDRFH